MAFRPDGYFWLVKNYSTDVIGTRNAMDINKVRDQAVVTF